MSSDAAASADRRVCLLREDGPAEGAWNMSLDEALLDRAASHGVATIRFYQWRPATLSLGYFQHAADRPRGHASADAPLVRRHSGGGAIVHHHELTYSIAAPPWMLRSRDPLLLYYAAHETLRDTLTETLPAGSQAEIALCPSVPRRPRSEEPFLCFLRRSEGDLLCRAEGVTPPKTPDGWCKITGSSQRKRQGAVLQHGSILLAASDLAPELLGFSDISGVSVSPEQLAQAWLPRLAERLAVEITPGDPGESMLELEARAIVARKFGHASWTARR